MLDGAGIPDTEDLCHHGVTWYTLTLGGALLTRLAAPSGPELGSILADSIDEVTDRHRHTCDVADPSSPQATVLLLRRRHDEAEILLLGDSFLLLDRHGDEPKVITDGREVAVRRACTALLDGLVAGTSEYAGAREMAVAAMRSQRNQTGGYWIAKDDPQAAEEAVTGTVPRGGVTDVALFSNGVTRLVDPYGLATWSTLLDRCRTDGPGAVLEELRRHETHISEPSDDATVAYSTLRQVPTPV